MIGFNFGRQTGRGMGSGRNRAGLRDGNGIGMGAGLGKGSRKGMSAGRGMGRGNGQCRFEMSPGLGCIRNLSQGNGELDPVWAERQMSRLESFIENIQQKISELKSRL
jgi:hypothetical protein